MRIIISVILPIALLVFGLWYSFHIHRKYLMRWHKEFNWKQLLLYLFPTFVKSVVIMYLIILIHNSAHSDHFFELSLFILVFFVFSILQSAYSLGGFLTRSKNIFYNAKSYFSYTSRRADKFVHRIIDIFRSRGELLVKIIIFLGFIFIFIPNITVFVTGNIVYFLLIFLLIGLSLVLNNIIYFGLVSLMIFQFDPVSITFQNVNYIVLFLSYIVILIGLSLENRLEHKMFMIISVMEVKRFNFKLGYNTLLEKKHVIVYQNIINKYYYVYFRKIGLVVVYYTDFDIKLSQIIMNQLIGDAKRFLLQNNEVIN